MIGESLQLQRKLASDAWELYLERRTWPCMKDLMQALAPVWMQSRGLSLAVIDEIVEAYDFSLTKNMLFRFCRFVFRVSNVRQNTPQYNDYLMAKWQLTGRRDLVRLMLHRMAQCKGIAPEVQASCEWMVNSVCSQDERFAAEFKAVAAEMEAA